jgi:hypothetical protein
MKYYVLEVWQDVEPFLHGPFDTENERDDKALNLRKVDDEKENGYYRLNVDENGIPSVDSYSGFELDPEDQE